MPDIQQEGAAAVAALPPAPTTRQPTIPEFAQAEHDRLVSEASLWRGSNSSVSDPPSDREQERIRIQTERDQRAEQDRLEREMDRQQRKEERDAAREKAKAAREEAKYQERMQKGLERSAEKEEADRAKAEKKAQRERDEAAAKRQSAVDEAQRIKFRQESEAFMKDLKESRKAKEKFDADMRGYDEVIGNPRASTKQRIDARRAKANKIKEENDRISKQQATFMGKKAGVQDIPKGKITSGRIIGAIGGGMENTLINIGDSLIRRPNPKNARANVKAETKALSGVVRNKNLGKNPFTSVIAPSQAFQRKYVTDGHGRSGQRATLEWRRAHRQYVNPQAQAAAAINENWMNQIAGMPSQPVRHRKRPAGSGNVSPLDRFVGNL